MHPIACAIIVCIMGSVATAQPETEAPVPQFRQNPAHTGVGPSELSAPLSLNWKHTVDGAAGQHMVSTPIADHEAVYFFVGKQMHAVWRKTGAPKWEKPLDLPDNVDSTPALADGVAVFGCRDGKVYFVDVTGKTGKVLDTFDMSKQHRNFPSASASGGTSSIAVQTSPAIEGGWVYLSGDDGWVYAVDLATRELQWQFRTNGPIKASPACWNAGVYVASTDGFVYGLTQRTGKLRWRTKLESNDMIGSPVLASSRVLVAAGKYVYACDFGKNGYVRWRFEAKDKIVCSPSVYGGAVIVGDAAGKLYALDAAADGNFSYRESNSQYILWQVPPEPPPPGEVVIMPALDVAVGGLEQPYKSSPLVVGDCVIARSGPRQINAFSLKDGSLVWHYLLSEAAGAVAAITPPPVSVDTEGGESSPPPSEPESSKGTYEQLGAIGLPGVGTQPGTGTTGGTTAGSGLVFEQEVFASFAAFGTDLYALADDGSLYAFSMKAADGVTPVISDAAMETGGGVGGARVAQPLKLQQPEVDDPNKYKFNGEAPVYVRMKAFDEGSGINPQSLKITQVQGAAGIPWLPAYDAGAGYIWAVYELSKRGVTKPLPEGDYVLELSVSDWAGNEGKGVVSFTVDYSVTPVAPPPVAAPGPPPGGGGEGEGGEGGEPMPAPGPAPGPAPAPAPGGLPGLPGLPSLPALPGFP